MDTVCICSKYHTFSLISRCSFSCSDSIDDDTYEFTTSRSPKIENMCLHFYGISFKVKDAMIGVLEGILGFWAPLVLGPPGGRLCCMAPEPALNFSRQTRLGTVLNFLQKL